jgi:hypothetical protein
MLRAAPGGLRRYAACVPDEVVPPGPPAPTQVGEPVEVLPGGFDVAAMARGEPGVPLRFRWRERVFEVEAVLGSERELDVGPMGGHDGYVRRHAVTVRTRCGARLVLTGSRSRGPARWTLRSIA